MQANASRVSHEHHRGFVSAYRNSEENTMKSKLLVLFGTLIMAVSMMAQTPTALANNAKDCCTQGAGCCPGDCC